jgi:hypothetical protein
MNVSGIIYGFTTLCLIGLGFLWVIRLEYYLGARIWKGVLALGILLCLVSLWVPWFWASALLGIFGGSVIWGATELPEQEKRVQMGLFPANPKRMQKGDHR